MGRYFGTDGIRGRANDTLKVETVFKIGRFIGSYYQGGKILIGKDTRLSGSMFENALACGISASGCDVYLLGYCSTPSLAYITMHEQFSCGCMISASHNPYYDNGVKIFGNDGIKINDEIENLIENYIDNPEGLDLAVDDRIGKILDHHAALKDYCNWLNELYPLDLSGHRFAVDLANGSNCLIARDVLRRTNADITYINDSYNGININNHCGSTHLEMLQELCKNGDYELGFAFDGDADRVLFVDRNGDVVDGDKLMYACALYLKSVGKLNNNTLVTTVMSNMGLFKALEKQDIASEITTVGDKNVLDRMLEKDFVIGGEQSGHIICTLDANFGDGLKTALMILSLIENEKKDIIELVKDLIVYPQLLVNQRVSDKKIVLADEDINKRIKDINELLGTDGRVLVRPSGTEPLIRVMVEAQSDEICHKYVYEIIDMIKEKGYAVEKNN